MLVAFISFHPFWWLGIFNILIMLCGAIALAAAIAMARAEDISTSNWGIPCVALFAIFAGMLLIFVPHWRTENYVHGLLARKNMTQYGQVIKVDVVAHTATVTREGCAAPVKGEMRRIRARHLEYWFARKNTLKTKEGNKTVYQAITPREVRRFCASHPKVHVERYQKPYLQLS
jgi:hypothetical protein